MKTQKIIAISLMIMMTASGLTFLAPNGATPLPARASSVTLTNFTYEPVRGTFPSPKTPVYYGTTVAAITTSWGQIGFGSVGFCPVVDLKIGAAAIPTWLEVFDTLVNAWTYDGIGHASRAFNTNWTGWFTIQADNNVASYQRYSQSCGFYGVTPIWNMTQRFTVLISEPVVRIDQWLRVLTINPAINNYSRLSFSPWTFYGGGDPVTLGDDASRKMSYRVADSGLYAVGAIGEYSPLVGGTTTTSIDYYAGNWTNSVASRDYYGSQMMVFGDDLGAIQTTADYLGDSWNNHQGRTDYNIVVANNSQRIDSIGAFSASGYIVYPSGTIEHIKANGAVSHIYSQTSRLASYSKTPFVYWMDDFGTALGDPTAPGSTWIYNMSERYGIAVTYAGLFITPSLAAGWYADSLIRNGTLIEIGDHGYNHTNLYSDPFIGQSYTNQRNLEGLSQSAWTAANGPAAGPLRSVALPFNAWSTNTFAALASAGVESVRLSWSATWMPQDLNLTGIPVFTYMFTNLYAYQASPNSDTLRRMTAIGYYIHQSHGPEYDTAPEQATVEPYLSWVQNQTSLLPCTVAQWSDLWHHRLHYSTVDGAGVYDLTSATVNHQVKITAVNGRLPLIWDMTIDTAADIASYDFSQTNMTVVMRAGHIYREVGSFKPTADLSLRTQVYDMGTNADPLFQVYYTGPTGKVDFTFTGLDMNQAYSIRVNGTGVRTYQAPDANGTLTVTNLTIEPGQTLTVVTVMGMSSAFAVMLPVVMLIMCVSLMVGFLGKKK